MSHTRQQSIAKDCRDSVQQTYAKYAVSKQSRLFMWQQVIEFGTLITENCHKVAARSKEVRFVRCSKSSATKFPTWGR